MKKHSRTNTSSGFKTSSNTKNAAKLEKVREAYFERQLSIEKSAYKEALRKRNIVMRRRMLNRLSELLTIFEARANTQNIRIHWAETSEDCLNIIKTLTSQDIQNKKSILVNSFPILQELAFNGFLKQAGIDATHTTLVGQYNQIIGNDHDHPVHYQAFKDEKQFCNIIANHYSKQEGFSNLAEAHEYHQRVFRKKCNNQSVLITGVNFLVKDTGQLCIADESGELSVTTSVCNKIIAIAGLEQIVFSITDIPSLLGAWSEKAHGKSIPYSVNFIAGPRQFGQTSGPEEVHLILLDNGRSTAWEDDELRQALQCIDCGACHFACPVTNSIGAHAYPSPKSGPIGAVMWAVQTGLSVSQPVFQASSLCGQCQSVCPVDVPLPFLLQRLRRDTLYDAKDNHIPLPDQGCAASTRQTNAINMAAKIAISPFLSRIFDALWSRFPSLLSRWQLPHQSELRRFIKEISKA